jgi:hypothetical protein
MLNLRRGTLLANYIPASFIAACASYIAPLRIWRKCVQYVNFLSGGEILMKNKQYIFTSEYNAPIG